MKKLKPNDVWTRIQLAKDLSVMTGLDIGYDPRGTIDEDPSSAGFVFDIDLHSEQAEELYMAFDSRRDGLTEIAKELRRVAAWYTGLANKLEDKLTDEFAVVVIDRGNDAVAGRARWRDQAEAVAREVRHEIRNSSDALEVIVERRPRAVN